MSHSNSVQHPSRPGRSAGLWGTVSGLALCAACALPSAALAGSYSAGDEAALRTAITSANADADPNATITLTGNIVITDPAAMPATGKTIVFNTGAFTLSGALKSAAGDLNFNGTGQVRPTGVSTLGGGVILSGGELRLESGAKLTAAAVARVTGNGTLTIDGAGSVLTANTLEAATAAGTTTILIQNRGVLHTTYTGSTLTGWGTSPGAILDLTVTGLGSLLDIDGSISLGGSTGADVSAIISGGATMTIGSRINVGSSVGAAAATPPSLQIDGGGSSLTVGTILAFGQGRIDVTAGGAVTAGSAALGGANGTVNLFVSGPGSSFTSLNTMGIGQVSNSDAFVTLADGGVLNVSGALTLANNATATGVLSIGGTEGAAAAAAGSLNTAGVAFGAGTGRLNFNHTDANYTFAMPISGTGAINQVAGVTHLTGNSAAYTGAATVSGGELHVDGVLGGPTSSVAVTTGGVLAGSGTLGGNVTVTNGVVAPGDSPGTLTIAGNLNLGAAALLDFEFGHSNVVGGPMNDLIKVGGNLTLDGTIDVSVTAGGVFDAGLYRVISYGGVLTDNGLTLGVTPPGSTVSVQTAIPGQVNLVNTAGLAVNFWDGDGAGSSGNGRVDGGAGTWTTAGLNWTTGTGAVNTAYTASDFLIFAGAPATVTVGTVTTSGGMQFAVDGYRLSGGTITLSGAARTFRVGDGTADGKNFVATIDSPIVGAGGGVTKTDLGTLILNGANTFTGVTTVSAGTLLFNGTMAGGGSALVVSANGTVGGTGRSRGGVINGTLAPGGLTTPGTLTFGGPVTLGPGATLRYRLGQAGTAGGSLNDLVVVNGNLTLNGTLNVTQSAGGSFLQGVYRLINYTGTLTDNVLDVGILPTGFTGVIQTSVANQVNLVATGAPTPGGGGGGGDPEPPPPPPPPPTFNFWDGDGAADGAIGGGGGIWRASPANWTTASGAANGAFTSGAFAIFAGQGGAVSVDGSDGAISVTGLQFAADGYRLSGDAVTLAEGDNIVRVGDGTSEGGKFVATIASELTGSGRLDKADAGALILTGANSYTGGTRISSGMLQIGDGGTAGSIRGDVANDGVLAFKRSDDVAYAGVVTGGGTLAQLGGGTLSLTGDSSAFTGAAEVRAGTLAIDGRLGGVTSVFSGGRLIGAGQVGGLVNQAGGVVSPGRAGVGVLTVAGDYAGTGGVLEMEAELGGDASRADRLVVRGATSGSTLVEIKRLGGTGAVTTGGILLVQVDGASGGTFALAKGDYRLGAENALVAGAYAYVLRKDAQGGDWRLRSNITSLPGEPVSGQPDVTLYQPGAPIYEAYPQALAALNAIGTLRQRTGARQWSGEEGASIWGRMEGGHARLEPKVTTTSADLKLDRWKLQFGVDLPLAEAVAGGQLVGGLTGHYGEASADVDSPFGRGDIDAKGYGFGANLTWTTTGGGYVDAQAQASWFDSDLSSKSLGERAAGAGGEGYAVSIEAGKTMAGAFGLTPQAQLTYARIDFDDFTDSFGAKVSADQGDSLVARLGLGLDHAWADGEGRVYGLVNLSHEFLDGSHVDVSGVRLASRVERTWGGVSAGVSYGWGAGRFLVYGEATADTSLSGFGDSYAAGGSAGFRMRF